MQGEVTSPEKEEIALNFKELKAESPGSPSLRKTISNQDRSPGRVTGQFSLGSERSPIMMTGINHEARKEEKNILLVTDIDKDILGECLYRTVRMEEFTKAKFSRVKLNIISSLSFLRNSTKKGVDTTKDNNNLSVWKELVSCEFNELIVTDCFWLMVLKKNSHLFIPEVKVHPKSKGLEHSEENKQSEQGTQKDLSRIIKTKTSVPDLNTLGEEGFRRTENYSPSKPRLPFIEEYYQIEDAILNRVAINYHDFFERYPGLEYQLFFQVATL